VLKFFKIGYVRSSYGSKGELRTRFSKRHVPVIGDMLYFEKTPELFGPHSLLSVRKHSGDWVIQISDCTDITQASKFSGHAIGIHRSHLEKGVYWIDDIIGCKVYTLKGDFIGDVKEVMSTGANDVYVLHSAEGKEVLIPAIKSVISSVDIDRKTIVIGPLPGLIE
jgi:16S rRNA processing protein RimM